VSEATKVGARLYDKVLVSDADGGLNADITLACVSSGPEDTACKHFKVETEKVGEGQYRGIVTLVRPLDYEQRSAYSLQLRATDGATDPAKRLSTAARIAVQVVDVQDQPPVFLNAPYSATVPERSPPVSVIGAASGTLSLVVAAACLLCAALAVAYCSAHPVGDGGRGGASSRWRHGRPAPGEAVPRGRRPRLLPPGG
jgi:hypothetical protein